MKNWRKLQPRILLTKAGLYRIFALIFQFIGSFILTGSVHVAVTFSLLMETAKTGVYFAYDCVFNKLFSVTTDTGCVLWFTGLPCSGKTTVGDATAERLRQAGVKVERLDGDIVREDLTSDLGFSKEDRAENLQRIRFVAERLARNGVVTICTFISPFREAREELRQRMYNFIEVYADCSVEECERRDVKGMYAKARRGEIMGFTGVDDPYEIPYEAELKLDTESKTVEQCVKQVVKYLKKRKII
jgi:adenylyl-sulfate kinase